ncbi:MAG: hypothetical protein K9L22_13210 [Methylococcaceae bacterium]|nr:hypothetical protein [Methylococcaceae bacterium]
MTCILIPTCMWLSVAMAEPVSSNAMLLTAGQMDQVTAGLGSAVYVDAMATSDFLALTHTGGLAITAVSNPDNPAKGGYVEVAGGEAYALTVGGNNSTNTTVSPVTSTQGLPGVYTTQVAGQIQTGSAEMSVNIIYTTGAMFNPF